MKTFMNNIRNLIVILIIGFLGLNSAWAQQAEIKVIAKIDTLAKGKKVLIRWAPTTAALWKLSNKQTTGYKLEKIRIVKNSAILATPEKVGNDEIIKIPAFDTLAPYANRNTWYSKFLAGTYTNRELIKGQDSLKTDSLSLNYAAMWQAVYGISFDLGAFRSDGIIDETDELNKRYNTALATAENYFEIAKFAGLGFEDANIVKGERYLYRISALATGYTTVVGTVYIGLDDNESITKIPPYEFAVSYVDSVAQINWNASLLKKYYSGYNLYRSINGQGYVKVNKSPLVSLDDDTNISYSDSLGIWNTTTKKYSFNLTNTFAYKIQGITPFGDKGPFSEVYSGTVRRILRTYPIITDLIMKDTKDTAQMFTTLSWKFDPTQAALISGFRISYSDSASGVYQNIAGAIAPNGSNANYVRDINEIQVKKTTYFKVTALANANAGENKESFPSVISPMDSLAPLPPKMLSVTQISAIKKGSDSLLIVQVNWQVDQPSKAENKHIVGYRVFRSQFLNEEGTQITNIDNIKGTSYRDTIYLSTQSGYSKLDSVGKFIKAQSDSNRTYSINKGVYYQVIAIDTNYNQSKLSAKIKFRRPDKTPLPPAVFSKYEVNEDGIALSWSEYPIVEMFNDFKEFQLIRATIPNKYKNNKDSILNLKNKDKRLIWYQIAVIPEPSDTSYIDVDVAADSMYAYCMLVKDSSNNVSASSIVIVQYSNTSNFDYTEPAITTFLVTKPTGKTYTKLNWTHTSTKVAEYQILRGVDESNLEILRVVGSTEKEFFDEDIKTGSLYKYGVRALYNNTKRSEMKRAEILY